MSSENILVVFDPDNDEQPALVRAARLVKSSVNTSLTIHVYSCIYTKIPKSEKRAARKAELIAAQKEIVNKAVSELVGPDIPVTIEVDWGKDWHKGVVRAAFRVGAIIVFKSSYTRSASRRLLKNSTERTLLRKCACPVLLVKSNREESADERIVLAAVQFRGEPGAYDELNHRIVDFCQRLYAADTVKVHFVNAYTDLSDRPDKGQLVRACGVPSDQAHIKLGESDDVIVETARELGADLVVIGNSARDGFAAVIKNNTAEKILDRLNCNLLAMP